MAVSRYSTPGALSWTAHATTHIGTDPVNADVVPETPDLPSTWSIQTWPFPDPEQEPAPEPAPEHSRRRVRRRHHAEESNP